MTLHLNVPDDLKALAETRARETGQSLDAYLASLIRADTEQDVSDELQSELLDALKTPAREFTAADWNAKRRDLLERNRPSRAG